MMKIAGGLDEQRLQLFWEGLFASHQGKHLRELHPHLKGKARFDLRHTAPLRLHEDAAPFAKTSSVINSISWSPIMGKGTELECKYLFCSHVKENDEPADDR